MKNDCDMTALMHAAQVGNLEMAMQLECELGFKDVDGRTALMHACQTGN